VAGAISRGAVNDLRHLFRADRACRREIRERPRSYGRRKRRSPPSRRSGLRFAPTALKRVLVTPLCGSTSFAPVPREASSDDSVSVNHSVRVVIFMRILGRFRGGLQNVCQSGPAATLGDRVAAVPTEDSCAWRADRDRAGFVMAALAGVGPDVPTRGRARSRYRQP
jgi:hypothetical protein